MATANQLINRLIAEETDASNAPDKRRILRDERLHLQAALQRGTHESIGAQMREAIDVAEMWGVRFGGEG